MQLRKKKLLYRSLHRGCKELDALLGEFAKEFLQSFTDRDLIEYEAILEINDVDLYNWITKKEAVPEQMSMKLLEKIIEFNNNR